MPGRFIFNRAIGYVFTNRVYDVITGLNRTGANMQFEMQIA